MWTALQGLATDLRAEILGRIRQGADGPGPVVCPFLDLDHGACLIYGARPVACRTYGFYVGRTGPRHCDLVGETVGEDDRVLWGNHDAVERRLQTLGTPEPVATHLRRAERRPRKSGD